MNGRPLRSVAITVVLSTFLAGCASTQPYAAFAQAGTVYVSAVDRLLWVAGNVGLDATSERLLQDDALKNLDRDSYRRLSQGDLERLAVIDRLRAHLRFLGRYFRLLNQFATAPSAERVQEEIGAVAQGLEGLGKQLRGSPLWANQGRVAAATKLAVGFAIRGLLKDELRRRQETIQVEIQTQE